MAIKPSVASIRAIFRELRKRIKNSGGFKYPELWER